MITVAPPISFVVIVYNMEPFIADCIRSILCQEGGHDYEVIVIDDASADASMDVVMAFDDPRIRLIRHSENMGAAYTITEGLSSARGAYVARIDADDRYRPHFLDRTVKVLDHYPEVGLVYGRVAMIDSVGNITQPSVSVSTTTKNPKEDRFFHLMKRNDLPAPTVLARREAWKLGLPIPASMKFNDWYLSLSIAERWPLFFTDEVLADYRIHDNNMHRAMIRDRWGEPIIMDVLERFLKSPGREEEKRKYRNEIYAAQYRQLADQYFGFDLLLDARRCYWRAILLRPDQQARVDVIRRLIATHVGRRPYELAKGLAKRALGC
jgi:glycosyltransferase involved in cell wall biosynthesis